MGVGVDRGKQRMREALGRGNAGEAAIFPSRQAAIRSDPHRSGAVGLYGDYLVVGQPLTRRVVDEASVLESRKATVRPDPDTSRGVAVDTTDLIVDETVRRRIAREHTILEMAQASAIGPDPYRPVRVLGAGPRAIVNQTVRHVERDGFSFGNAI